VHLGQPARSLVPTLDAPVLLALHATTRPLTGRRLATLAGASHTAVNAILGRLTRAGVVLAERHGNAVLYRANRDHVGWAVVEALAGMRRSALDAMRAEIASWQTAPVTALCFGSFARGEGDEDSDVDLLLVRPPTWLSSTTPGTVNSGHSASSCSTRRATTARSWTSTCRVCFGMWIWTIRW
jgi:DNA-binding transcriptional ArsR family regulator